MKRLILTTGLFTAVASVYALATFTSVFAAKYSVAKTSNLGKLGCAVCHAGPKGGKLNAYGNDLKAALKAANTKKLTAGILEKVEGLDSNKNGVKNGDEIRKDHAPG